jgi:hypothetical protein
VLVPASAGSAAATTEAFASTTRVVAERISAVSTELRAIAASAAAAAVGAAPTAPSLDAIVAGIQASERTRFATTVALQKLVTGHLRGADCATKVHGLECGVFAHFFARISGTALARVTAAETTSERRRHDGGDGVARRGTIDASSDSEPDVATAPEAGDQRAPVVAGAAASMSCDEATKALAQHVAALREATAAVIDAELELQAAVSDS